MYYLLAVGFAVVVGVVLLLLYLKSRSNRRVQIAVEGTENLEETKQFAVRLRNTSKKPLVVADLHVKAGPVRLSYRLQADPVIKPSAGFGSFPVTLQPSTEKTCTVDLRPLQHRGVLEVSLSNIQIEAELEDGQRYSVHLER